MECRLIQASERSLYEAAAEMLPVGALEQTWAWGEIEESQGTPAIRLAVLDRSGPRLLSTLFVRTLPPPLGAYLDCPGGPLLGDGDWDALAAFLDRVREEGLSRGALWVRMAPDIERTPEASWMLRSLGFIPSPGSRGRHVARLSLTSSTEEIFEAFHPKGRYNVRLAYRRGVRVVAGEAGDLPVFTSLLTASARRHRGRTPDGGHVRSVFESFIPHSRGILLLAFRQGEPLAGALVVQIGSRAIWYLGGSKEEVSRHMAPYLVQWEAIHWAHRAGALTYDFAEVAPPGREDGLWTFASRFGCRRAELIGAWDLPLHPLSALWRRAWPAFPGVGLKASGRSRLGWGARSRMR